MGPTRLMGKTVPLLLVITAGALSWWAFGRGGGSGPATRLRIARVERGQVIEGVQASGAIQPLLLVQVGTQVSGAVEKLMKDFNSRVAAGETIALLDSRRLVAQVLQDEASLGRARADVERVRAQLRQAERNLERQRFLSSNNVTTEHDLDAAVANADALRAQLDVAAAVVSQSIAQLEGSLVNLRYATIRSPVDGVVVSRNVDVGQTVAASLAAPTLYVIANDLSKVQVQASVPEADVGKIREGQRARFTVDAYPDLSFEGRVTQVRLGAQTVQNVVTYTVLVDAENRSLVLLPGMTANLTFEIARGPEDGLKVNSSALRFQPPPELLETPTPRPAGKRRTDRGTLYVKTETARLRPVRVKAGVSDGVFTAVEPVEPGALDEESEVATGLVRGDEVEVTNPFAPRWGPGGRPRGIR